jgi:Spindle and kinetochore-associated protein 2
MVDRGQNERPHPAISDLMTVLSKANNDLTNVQHRLQIDFQQSYPDHVRLAIYIYIERERERGYGASRSTKPPVLCVRFSNL